MKHYTLHFSAARRLKIYFVKRGNRRPTVVLVLISVFTLEPDLRLNALIIILFSWMYLWSADRTLFCFRFRNPFVARRRLISFPALLRTAEAREKSLRNSYTRATELQRKITNKLHVFFFVLLEFSINSSGRLMISGVRFLSSEKLHVILMLYALTTTKIIIIEYLTHKYITNKLYFDKNVMKKNQCSLSIIAIF